jgi:predicted lipoprotein with Yx(FWY)xxD motif
MLLRRSVYVAIGLLMAMFVAACGSNTTTTGSTASPGSTGTVVVKTAAATVKGQSQTILTNTAGMTLYYFTADTATSSACSGSCANTWPALLNSGSGAPASATALSGTLSAVTDANGNQVEYNGHPLYVYSGDTAPGQTNGEGLFGKWFVATPTIPVQSAPSSSSTPYGY